METVGDCEEGLQPGQPFFAILLEVVDEFRFGRVGIDEKLMNRRWAG